MATDPYALTDLTTIKQHLNIDPLVTSQDAVLERMIDAASAKIESFLDRKVLTRSWTEYQDGRANDRILLKHWPCSKPSEVWDDPSGLFTDSSNQLASDEFELEGDPAIGIVLLGSRYFNKGTRNIKIVYDAGYATVPYDIEEACLFTVEYLYDMRSDRRIGVSTKGKNGETTTFLTNLPEFVIDMLLPYQRVEFGHANIAVQNA